MTIKQMEGKIKEIKQLEKRLKALEEIQKQLEKLHKINNNEDINIILEYDKTHFYDDDFYNNLQTQINVIENKLDFLENGEG